MSSWLRDARELSNITLLHKVITRSSSMHSSQLCTMETFPHVPNVQ